LVGQHDDIINEDVVVAVVVVGFVYIMHSSLSELNGITRLLLPAVGISYSLGFNGENVVTIVNGIVEYYPPVFSKGYE